MVPKDLLLFLMGLGRRLPVFYIVLTKIPTHTILLCGLFCYFLTIHWLDCPAILLACCIYSSTLLCLDLDSSENVDDTDPILGFTSAFWPDSANWSLISWAVIQYLLFVEFS